MKTIYNNRYYRLYGKSLNVFRLQKHITQLKKLEKYSFWRQVSSQAIQNIIQRIDFGLKTYLTFSDGTEEKLPLFFKRGMKTIRKASQNLSSKEKGSHQRKDSHFQWANTLCQSYEYIFIEDF